MKIKVLSLGGSLNKKLWSISTTVRNPYRILEFARIIKQFEGCKWDEENQIKYQIELIRNRIYGYGNPQFINSLDPNLKKNFNDPDYELSYKEAEKILLFKNYKDPSMRGRQSINPLKKMGLVYVDNKGTLILTELMDYLESNEFDLSNFFFKSFLKWQYPNPLSKTCSDEEIFNIIPFICTLHLIRRVNELCVIGEKKPKGISKLEFSIFVMSLINYKEINKKADDLMDFRRSLYEKETYNDKRNYVSSYMKTYLKEFTNLKHMKDYSDNTIRYFRLTKYIMIRGGGYYIDLEPRREIELSQLLRKYSGEAKKISESSYTDYISNINKPELPWKSKSNLSKILAKINEEIRECSDELAIPLKEFNIKGNAEELEIIVDEARDYRFELQNKIAKNKLQNIDYISELIKDLENISNSEMSPSIQLEYLCNKAMVVINDAVSISPNYPKGDDNKPTYTAPANVPDIECFYNSFNTIVEVTMLKNRQQWYNEGQPVMRHLRNFEDKYKKESYCIFIAPYLHQDTLSTFWISVKYEYKGIPQRIVPITINQFIDLLKFIIDLKEKKLSINHKTYRLLLDNIINCKDSVNDYSKWSNNIKNIFDEWKKEIVNEA